MTRTSVQDRRPDGPRKPRQEYSLGEEIANAVTHGVGVALAIAALVVLSVLSAFTRDPVRIASAVTFGVTLVLLYAASTLYHSIPNERARHVLKVLDHASIYLLIAGTYTPFTLVTLRERGGIALLAVVWGLAAAGVALESFWVYRPRWVSTVVYLAMGWLVVAVIKPLVGTLAPGGLALLAAGGVAYTLGTAFYLLKRFRYMHMVWHLFVLAGSALHVLAVALYVLPAS
ncbi:MAG: hemolysin III family protein [Anaerosomatales bacterium]|nr:hemolysin III family protein [Anaerosomatales bacterium]